MTKSVKWSLTAAIVVFIAALAFYPDIKRKFQGSKDEIPMSPSKGGGRNQVLNVNAEVIKFQHIPCLPQNCLLYKPPCESYSDLADSDQSTRSK